MPDDKQDWSIEEHRARKQRSREDDARRLAAGEVTREELGRENGLFSNRSMFKNIRIIHHGFTVHPGPWVNRQVIEPAGLTLKEFAEEVGIREASLAPVIAGKQPMTPEIASGIEDAFRILAGTLMRMQSRYDEVRQ